MAKRKPKLEKIEERQRWAGDTGFRLGEFTEADMRSFAGGQVPPWLQRTAASLLQAQAKYTIRFEEQAPREEERQAS